VVLTDGPPSVMLPAFETPTETVEGNVVVEAVVAGALSLPLSPPPPQPKIANIPAKTPAVHIIDTHFFIIILPCV